MKTCQQCEGSMEGKRSNAIYCSRTCKTAASEQRRPPRDNRARYLNEREHRLAAARNYHLRNPQVAHKRRLTRRGLLNQKFTITAKDWRRLVARHQECCFYCGQKKKLTADHVIPLSRGGRHSIGNIVPACLSCNSSKHTRTIQEWKHGRRSPRRPRYQPTAHDRSNLGQAPGRELVAA